MTEKTYKTGIAFLGKLFGVIDDDRYRIYWNLLKFYTDKDFEAVVHDIAMSFNPTSFIPFPTPGHFNKARDAVIKRAQYNGQYLPYKPFVIAEADLPTTEFLEEWKNNSVQIVKSKALSIPNS
jgi:hypothetical protein